ncbi:flagellar motor switch protein FliM [Vulgatibacter sp.]|uniref:flagellar motor switch protein FliM n=1 Tax=Vulgatibacter sp. TaxID=1971226 RepID=UPI0035638E01
MAVLEAEELDALMSAISDGRVAPQPPVPQQARVSPWDLTSRDRIIRGQMPTLDSIDERVASLFGAGLSGRTRLDLTVTSAPASMLKLGDVQILLAPPAITAVFSLQGGQGKALAVLEAGLADALLAAALGDRKPRQQPQAASRELTPVDRVVLQRLLGLLAEAMNQAWAAVLPLQVEVVRVDSDPRLSLPGPANEVAILAPFEIAGPISGRIQLVIPWAAVEPAKKLLAAPPGLGPGTNLRFAGALAEELQAVRVQLSARLGATEVTLARLLELQVGDVLVLSGEENRPLPVLVEGREKLVGMPLVSGGNLAVRLAQGVQAMPGDRIAPSEAATERA